MPLLLPTILEFNRDKLLSKISICKLEHLLHHLLVQWKFEGEGVAKANVFKDKYGAKLEFPKGAGRGGKGANQKKTCVVGV